MVQDTEVSTSPLSVINVMISVGPLTAQLLFDPENSNFQSISNVRGKKKGKKYKIQSTCNLIFDLL